MAITVPSTLDLTQEKLAIGDTDAAVTKMNNAWDKLETYTGQANQMATDINGLAIDTVASEVNQYKLDAATSATNAATSANNAAQSATDAANAAAGAADDSINTALANLSPTIDDRVASASQQGVIVEFTATWGNGAGQITPTLIGSSSLVSVSGNTITFNQDCVASLGFNGNVPLTKNTGSSSDVVSNAMVGITKNGSYIQAKTLANIYNPANSASIQFVTEFMLSSPMYKFLSGEQILFNFLEGTLSIRSDAQAAGIENKITLYIIT